MIELCSTPARNFWGYFVSSFFPTTKHGLTEAVITVDEHWQFTICFRTIDGRYIPIKYPQVVCNHRKSTLTLRGFVLYS